ncbi:hypothetical protein [Nitrospirillum viridazoti]|nr:hypothetical protein [Nitrospirillum amazonense]
MPSFWTMMAAATGLVLTMMGPATVQAQPSRRQDIYIDKAVFADDQLWLLSGGELSRIAENGDSRIVENLPDRVLDLCAQHNQPVVITGPQRQTGPWTIRRRVEGQWRVEATVTLPENTEDRVETLDCRADRLLLLTTHRLIEAGRGIQNSLHLNGSLLTDRGWPGHIVATHDAPGQLLVAFNAGEWSGRVQSIDLNTGAVASIKEEGSAFGHFMGNPNALLPLPWEPRGRKGCLAMSVGLVHFAASGMIMTVCDGVARPLYKTLLVTPPGPLHNGDETVPFYGLMADGDALIASGLDGMYRITADGKAVKSPLPKLQNIDGAWVSFDLPHVVLVGTVQRLSVGPLVPMMVPR